MMKAVKIHLVPYHSSFHGLWEIDSIYLIGSPAEKISCKGFYSTDKIYDYLTKHPGSIEVNLPPYPKLIPILSPYPRRKKLVRSSPDHSANDNLFNLPIE